MSSQQLLAHSPVPMSTRRKAEPLEDSRHISKERVNELIQYAAENAPRSERRESFGKDPLPPTVPPRDDSPPHAKRCKYDVDAMLRLTVEAELDCKTAASAFAVSQKTMSSAKAASDDISEKMDALKREWNELKKKKASADKAFTDAKKSCGKAERNLEQARKKSEDAREARLRWYASVGGNP